MAAPWLHTGLLLVLLAVSCPGSRGTAVRHLCGIELLDALNLVCGERMFYFTRKTADKPGALRKAAVQPNQTRAKTDVLTWMYQQTVLRHCPAAHHSRTNTTALTGASLTLTSAAVLSAFQPPVATGAASSGAQREAAIKFPSKDLKRSIVDKCCIEACTLWDLDNYCSSY